MVIRVKIKSLGKEGYISNDDRLLKVELLINNTEYYVRYKGTGGGYIGKKINSNDLEIIKA